MGSIFQYLLLLDVPHKRRMEGQDLGLWIGMKFYIIYGSVYQLIGEIKWANNWPIILKMVTKDCIGINLGLN